MKSHIYVDASTLPGAPRYRVDNGGPGGKCKFCGPRGGAGAEVVVGGNQFKLHNSDRSVKEISSDGGAAARSSAISSLRIRDLICDRGRPKIGKTASQSVEQYSI